MQHSTVAVAALFVLVVWRVVARVRRLVGRQPVRLWRHRATVLAFPFLVGLLMLGSLGEAPALIALFAGSVVGGALAVAGVRRTRFETGDDGALFYTPCAPIGIGVAMLLVARIGYHALEWFEARQWPTAAPDSLVLTPTTLFLFATFALYQSGGSLGVLRWHRRVAGARRRHLA